MQQPAGDLEASLHTAGKRLDQVIAAVPELEHLEQDLGPLPPNLARHVIQHAVDVHVLPRREIAVETRVLEHDAEAPPHFRLMPGGIEPIELERPARWLEQRREHLDGGGLPGAVRT